MTWEQKIDDVVSEIVKDYFFTHNKFPKKVKCNYGEFVFSEFDKGFRCVIYNQMFDREGNSNRLHTAIFIWDKIAIIKASLKKKNDRSNRRR